MKFYDLPMSQQNYVQSIIRKEIPPAMELGKSKENISKSLYLYRYDEGEKQGFSLWDVHLQIKTVHLLKLWTVESERGKGLAGNHMLQRVTAFKEMGVETFWLEVLESNLYALTLYRSLGFQGEKVPKLFPGDKAGLRMQLSSTAFND